MKIVYCIAATFNSGGMERVLANKANYLSKLGHEITIITTDQQGRSPYFNMDSRIEQLDLGIDYSATNKQSLVRKITGYFYKQLKHKRALTAKLHAIKADIVISMYDNDASLLYKIQDGSKKILEIHFSRFKRLQYARGGLIGFIDRYRSKTDLSLVQKYDQFVVLTQEDKSYWGSLSNIHVIANANSFDTELSANMDSKQVIAVGRYDFQKGFDDLIKAWQQVYKLHPDWKLRIFGNGPLKEELQRLISKLNITSAVTLEPAVKNIQQQYLSSAILAMTSRYEGLPMVLLEGQTCGLPLVSYACKCGPKDLITDSVNGFLVPEGDIDTFANRLINLIENKDLRQSMSQVSKTLAQNYREEVIMKKWIDLFNQTLAKK